METEQQYTFPDRSTQLILNHEVSLYGTNLHLWTTIPCCRAQSWVSALSVSVSSKTQMWWVCRRGLRNEAVPAEGVTCCAPAPLGKISVFVLGFIHSSSWSIRPDISEVNCGFYLVNPSMCHAALAVSRKNLTVIWALRFMGNCWPHTHTCCTYFNLNGYVIHYITLH